MLNYFTGVLRTTDATRVSRMLENIKRTGFMRNLSRMVCVEIPYGDDKMSQIQYEENPLPYDEGNERKGSEVSGAFKAISLDGLTRVTALKL